MSRQSAVVDAFDATSEFERSLRASAAETDNPGQAATPDLNSLKVEGEFRFGDQLIGIEGEHANMTVKEALQVPVDDPRYNVARSIVSQDMQRRNRPNQGRPEPMKKLFLVDRDPIPVSAKDPVDALAVHNQKTGMFPSPNGRIVRQVRMTNPNAVAQDMLPPVPDGFELVD